MPFNPLIQEPKIQQCWEQENAFRSLRADELKPGDQTFYMLVMLPYPSGRIHIGHVRNYTLGDVVARFRRMRGEKVMHPLGWDSFGLPAENAAIKNKIHPAIWTRKNIEEMKAQIQKMGLSYDWHREIATFTPKYYKWNQWFFLQMWKRGDVFRAMRNVNWCEALGTVLANEQVVDGKDERTGHPVVQKPMEQYFFHITKYADELISGLDQIDWPENVKSMQRHWIGRSDGAKLWFDFTSGEKVQVFTTRLDTLFGVTFLVLSTEHPFIVKAAETDPGLRNFCDEVAHMSREDRLMSDIKLGHKSKLEALHPFTGEKVPVFAANYVLMDYGTGAVMGVPAHDERDFDFAKKYGMEIPTVIAPADGRALKEGGFFSDFGVLVNSGEYTAMTSEAAIDLMVEQLGSKAEKAITFKLRDWGLSRQRYWGTPIPIVHCPDCGVVPEKEENLPVALPEDVEFHGQGPSPLLTSKSFLNCSCPQCGKPATRETDTMDTFVDSSWYWYRYLDPDNEKQPFNPREWDAYGPVNLYIGGVEHATMHLIYARYFHKVLRDLGFVSNDEPFAKLICQGMVLKDGFKMSKSKGNIVDPNEVIAEYGADALRLFMIFAAPIEKEIDWTGFEGIDGATRFLRRVCRMVDEHTVTGVPVPPKERLSTEEKALMAKTHQTLHKVTDDLSQRYQFNTLISSLMELSNSLQGLPNDSPNHGPVMQHCLEIFVKMLSPAAPHTAEQLWDQMEGSGFCMHAKWPDSDNAWIQADEVTVVVQVNGKVRGRIMVPCSATPEQRRAAALECSEARPHIDGREVLKVVVPAGGKLVSIVVKA